MVTGPAGSAKAAPRAPGEDLSEERLAAVRARYDELMRSAPAPVKGKPSAEQLVLLQV
jgi:hypothetical protein